MKSVEKRKPHYPLSRVKARMEAGAFRATKTALQCAVRDFRLLKSSDLALYVLALEAKDFYKSMTAHHDSTLWQDVYHGAVGHARAYIKVQIVDDTTVIVAFKCLENGA